MEPQNLRFGGGAAASVLNPLVAVAMVLAIGLILFLPRKYSFVPLLLGTFMIPLGQVVVLAGIHFTVVRILIISGLVRRLMAPKAEEFKGGFNAIDRYTVFWTLAAFVVFCLQWMEIPAMIATLGDLLDRLGGFLALRFMIQDKGDLKRAIRVFAVICLVMSMFMLNEQITGRNVFGLLGGISLYPQIRNGHLRSQGAFGSYIDAGVFGGLLVPLFIWLWTSDRRSRHMAAVGIVGATLMCVTCHTSTAPLACFAGLFGLCLWPLRESMRNIRLGLVATLIGLQLVMKAPVWALIDRIDLTGSSSSYHRYYLVNNCIIHFWNWWLLGTKTYDTWGWDMWDLSDQYVACAVTGGLITLVLFIAILSRSFGGIGTARKLVRGKKDEWLLWCLGSTVFAMVACFFGCSFMAQMQIELFAFLAMISVAIREARQLAKVKVSVVEKPVQQPELEPAAVGMFGRQMGYRR
jgi:hypothetical protein